MDSFRSNSKYLLTLWLLLSCINKGNSQNECPDWDPTIMKCSTGFAFSYTTCTCSKATTVKTTTKTTTQMTTSTTLKPTVPITTGTTVDPRKALEPRIKALIDNLTALQRTVNLVDVQDQACKDIILSSLASYIASAKKLQTSLYTVPYATDLSTLTTLEGNLVSIKNDWIVCQAKTTTTTTTTEDPRNSLLPEIAALIDFLTELRASSNFVVVQDQECKDTILADLSSNIDSVRQLQDNLYKISYSEASKNLNNLKDSFDLTRIQWTECQTRVTTTEAKTTVEPSLSSEFSDLIEEVQGYKDTVSSADVEDKECKQRVLSRLETLLSIIRYDKSVLFLLESAEREKRLASAKSEFSSIQNEWLKCSMSSSSEGPSSVESSVSSESSAPSTEGPSSEGPSSEGPSSEGPSSDNPSSDTPSSDTPSSDTPSSDTPSSYTPSSDTPSSDTPSSDTPSSDTPRSDTPSSDTNSQTDESSVSEDSVAPTPWWTMELTTPSTADPLVCKPPKISYCYPNGPCIFWNPQRMHCPDHYNFNTDFCSCMPDYNYFSLPNCNNACDCYEYLNLTTCKCMCTPVNCTEFGKIWNQDKCECEAIPIQLPPEKPICSISSCRPCDRLDMLKCTCERREVKCPPKYEPVGDGCNCIKSNETSPLCPGLICMNGPSINEARCSCILKSCNGTCPTGYLMDLDTCECACGLKEWQCPPETPFLDDFNCLCIRPICDPISPCPDDTKWNSDTCRCECIDPPTCPLQNFVLDLPTCQCVCVNETCPPGHILNELACICVPDPDPSCPNKLTYDHDKCECVCAPESRICEFGLQWDETECDCICVKNEVCLDQFIWDQDKCQCVCNATVINTQCQSNQTFDYLKCQCIDNPIPSCQRGFVYNSTLCDCVCAETKLCVGGNIFDPDLCDCVCPEVTECFDGIKFNIDLCQCIELSASSETSATSLEGPSSIESSASILIEKI